MWPDVVDHGQPNNIIGYFHRAGGSWFICPCPCAVALLCAMSLANNYNRPTAVDAKLSVVHWNVPRISRLPRCVIADIVLASSPSELEDSKRDLFLPPSLAFSIANTWFLERIPTHLLICARRVRLMANRTAGSITRRGAAVPRFSENTGRPLQV